MIVSDERIKEIVSQSLTMRDASEKLNMPFMTFKRRALKLGLYKTNQGGKNVRDGKGGVPRTDLKEILEGLHPNFLTGRLKSRLLEAGIKEEKCEECGLENVWNNKKLILHLDHIDGNKKNHKLINLKMLCPNCHSQTETYCGKNLKKKNLANGYKYKSRDYQHLNKQ